MIYIHGCRSILSKILLGCRTLRNSIFWLKSDINISLNEGKHYVALWKLSTKCYEEKTPFSTHPPFSFEWKLNFPKVTNPLFWDGKFCPGLRNFSHVYDHNNHNNNANKNIHNREPSTTFIRMPFGPNRQQIPWRFHVIYPGFICFPCPITTWTLDEFKSWNFHGIC